MLRRAERCQEAEKALREAIERFETLGRRGREGAAAAWNNLALVYRDTGNPERGAEACRNSVELCRVGTLPLLPIAEAEPVSLEALAAARLQYPPGSEDLQIVLENAALVKVNLGKPADAQPYLIELSIRPFDEYLPPGPNALLRVYELHLQSNDYTEAARVSEELKCRLVSPKVPISLGGRLRARKRSIDESFGIAATEPHGAIFDELVARHRSDIDSMILHFERLRNRPALFPEASVLKPGSRLLQETPIRQVIAEQSLRFGHFIAGKDLPISDLVKLRPGPGEEAPIAEARAKAAGVPRLILPAKPADKCPDGVQYGHGTGHSRSLS